MLHLNDQGSGREDRQGEVAKLDKMQPGLRAKMIAEKKAALADSRAAGPRYSPGTAQRKAVGLAAKAEEAIKVTDDEVARKISGSHERRDAAKKLAKEAWQHEQLATYIKRYRGT